MEPVSTLIMFTSIAVSATARQRWEPPRIEAKSTPQTVLVEIKAAPTTVLVAPVTPRVAATQIVTLRDRLLKELESFSPDQGTDPGIISNVEDIATASQFLKTLPAGIPLPTLMRSDDGQIGMYWDIDDVYLDINIDPGRTLSLFSRIRSEGHDTFIDSIPIEAITPNWAFEHMAVLTDLPALAA